MTATCTPVNKQCRDLIVEYDMTNVRGSVAAEDNVLREHRIVENCEHESAGACLYDCAMLIAEMYDSGREAHKSNYFPATCRNR